MPLWKFLGRLSGPRENATNGLHPGVTDADLDRRTLVWLKTRQGAISWLRLVDLACAGISLIVAAWMSRTGLDLQPNDPALRLDAATFVLFVGLFVATVCVFSLFALYTEAALFEWREAVKASVKAVTGVVMLLIAGAAALSPPLVTPTFLATYWLMAAIGGVGARIMTRRLLFLTEAQGITARRTVIVGTDDRAQELAFKMLHRPEHGFRFLGFVADDWNCPPPSPVPQPFRLLTDYAGFAEFVRDSVVDEVVVCLPLGELAVRSSSLAADCEEHGVSFTVVTRLFELKNPWRGRRRHGGEVVVTVANTMADERERIFKRGLDVIVSFAALAVLSPLLVLTWALVRLTSRGPAIFTQERVGLNKRHFKFYKFRTMVENAPALQAALETRNEMDGALFKIRRDPRITPIGRILRKTSIDELPQLFNVLRGDMSLVGPRPLPLRDVERIEKIWPRRRFGVKPGITCLWQISGRNALSFDRMMELDIAYVDTWTIMLDFRILLRTIPVVLSMRGAY